MYPQFLPDNRHFLYVARSGRPQQSGAYVGSLDSKPIRLFSTTSFVRYAPPGYLLSVRDGALVAQPFNPATFAIGPKQRRSFDRSRHRGRSTAGLMCHRTVCLRISRSGLLPANSCAGSIAPATALATSRKPPTTTTSASRQTADAWSSTVGATRRDRRSQRVDIRNGRAATDARHVRRHRRVASVVVTRCAEAGVHVVPRWPRRHLREITRGDGAGRTAHRR